MTTRDNAAPPADWRPTPRPNPLEPAVNIPANIVLGAE